MQNKNLGRSWLPNLPSHKFSSAKPSHSDLIWVTDLKHENYWNDALINELFNPAEVSAIKSIQIREAPCQDRWVWKFTSKGMFSVKYAYHAQVQNSHSMVASSSCSLGGVSTTSWKSLWNISFMPKVCNFLWKTLHNRLSVGENLLKRKVDIDNVCHLCEDQNESVKHLFIICPLALSIWSGTPLSFLMDKANHNSFSSG